MKVIERIADMQKLSRFHRAEGKKIAVIPTMGFLHEGHLSLIYEAKKYADIIITTIFVNPKQFGPNEDFEKYPRDIEKDKILAEQADSDYLFLPEANEVYPDLYSTNISVSGITAKFEGASRPGHFDGVSTVVAKLFNATLPDYALFGRKDYQQTLLIKRMTSDLNFPIEIIVVDTKREVDGLAMSSRNKYLSTQQREKASLIYLALKKAKEAIEKGELNRIKINEILEDTINSEEAFVIDYACAAVSSTLAEPDTFMIGEEIVLLAAAYLGPTRLIDNMVVKS